MQTNKDTPILSGTKMFNRDSSFWLCKDCAIFAAVLCSLASNDSGIVR